MNDKQLKDYNSMVDKINTMQDEELDKLINNNKCPFEPELIVDEPMGMFHCPLCGEMVVAAAPHPVWPEGDWLGPNND
ncbi:MAG: hypothetical protein M0P71_18150 [Melioribacteraceae bacterium]|nr:hypothetical protein [Melioribacteraceae bacterium]